MRPLTEGWIAVNRLRRRIGKPPQAQWRQSWRTWIGEQVPGKSFADIGGLFGAAGEVAFVAEDAGASAVTLFDGGDVEYTAFPAEHERRASKIRFVQGDLHDPLTVERVGLHDIVWCTGVLYHTPNPLDQLMQLRAITREQLYLGCLTIPELPGVENGCVFYPYLDEDSRRAHSRAHYRPEGGLGIGVPIDERPMLGYGNFWWGITPSALRSMLRSARFEVVEERHPHDHPWLTEIVARPVERHPMMPPVDYYRRRREARERGEPLLPHEDYYERQADERRSVER